MSERDPLEQAVEALRHSASDPPDGGAATAEAIQNTLRRGAAWGIPWKWIAGATGAAATLGTLIAYFMVIAPAADEGADSTEARQAARPSPAARQPPPSDAAIEVPAARSAPDPRDEKTIDTPLDAEDEESADASAQAPPIGGKADVGESRGRVRAPDPSAKDGPRRRSETPSPSVRSPTLGRPTQTPAPHLDPEASRRRFREIHRLQFRATPERMLAAWDAYLAEGPVRPLAIEARYHRAVILTRLGRTAQARKALRPFARGAHGTRRQQAARRLLQGLEEKPRAHAAPSARDDQ